MDSDESARSIVEKMLEHDPFSRWLGIEIVSVSPGSVILKMLVRPEMVNGFDLAHGGIVYSLADSAIAFAANTRGKIALTLDNTIHYPEPVYAKDTIYATVKEQNLSSQTGLYDVTIENQDRRMVAFLRGTVYRTKKDHSVA